MEEYERIQYERLNKTETFGKKQLQKTQMKIYKEQNKEHEYQKEYSTETKPPDTECIGTLSFDKFGMYIAYPQACDQNGEKTLNSCFNICESDKEGKINVLINNPINTGGNKNNALLKIQTEWEKCIKNCRKRAGIEI